MKYKKSIIGSSIAFIIATSCCWLPALLIALGGGTTIISLSKGLEKFSGLFFLLGIALLGYGLYHFYKQIEAPNTVILQSNITCPNCNHQKEETMPTNACQYFYECENCHVLLKPINNDCCVFCSYGSVVCPPIQLNENCC